MTLESRHSTGDTRPQHIVFTCCRLSRTSLRTLCRRSLICDISITLFCSLCLSNASSVGHVSESSHRLAGAAHLSAYVHYFSGPSLYCAHKELIVFLVYGAIWSDIHVSVEATWLKVQKPLHLSCFRLTCNHSINNRWHQSSCFCETQGVTLVLYIVACICAPCQCSQALQAAVLCLGAVTTQSNHFRGAQPLCRTASTSRQQQRLPVLLDNSSIEPNK